MRRKIAVFGSAVTARESADYALAVGLGKIIAGAGFDILCGGYGGMMEAVCRGCVENGGSCSGIGLTIFTRQPNQYITRMKKVETLGARLDWFNDHADRFLALAGGIGTITEVMFFLDNAKIGLTQKTPLILYGRQWPALLGLMQKKFAVPPDFRKLVKTVGTRRALAAHLTQ